MKYRTNLVLIKKIDYYKMNQQGGIPLFTCYNQHTKIALAAYATEYGSITMLSTHQLDLIRKVIATLEPVEEITK